jgi:1,4-alpha-glucan branching enzyme
MAGKTKTKSPTRATKIKKSASPAKKNGSTEFALFAPDAKEVFVVGEFDKWNSEKNRMRRFKTGVWKKKIPLKPGRYEYRFVVDGDWWCDPECAERLHNPFGTENSVVTVG